VEALQILGDPSWPKVIVLTKIKILETTSVGIARGGVGAGATRLEAKAAAGVQLRSAKLSNSARISGVRMDTVSGYF
jgi:hypothetical protein